MDAATEVSTGTAAPRHRQRERERLTERKALNDHSSIYEELIAELMYLRKDRGFTISRLDNAYTLLELLGGDDQSFQDLRARFVSAVNSLPDKQAASLLLAVYGLSPEYANADAGLDIMLLAKRRLLYGQRINLKPDAVAKHENAAIRELAIRLLSARYTMSALPFSPSVVPHNAALHEYVEIATTVKDRLWHQTKETYRLISLVNDVGWLDISSDIPAAVTSTCNAAVRTEPSSNGLRHRFYFDKPLMRGQATTLAFTMTPDESLAEPDSLVLIEETRAFHEPTLGAKFTVTFIGQRPSIIWQYDHLAIYERPSRPKRRQLLKCDADGVATASFSDLYGGMYSGVAWGW